MKLFFIYLILSEKDILRFFNFNLLKIIICGLMLETFFYVSSIIFLEDVHGKSDASGRGIILLFINYFEIILGFAFFYQCYWGTEKSIYDLIYFSFITATTIGYGDISPLNEITKTIVIIQTIVTLIFGSLFFNSFLSRKTGA